MPELSLEGKVAIVTGGGRGLGKAIALSLAGFGAATVLAGRTESYLEETVQEIKQLGREALAIPTDVTKLDQVKHMVERTVSTFDKVDILVNNAGAIIEKSLLDHTEEEWRSVLDVNLTSQFLCCKAVAPYFVEQQKSGKVINVASMVGASVAGVNRISYCASKGGVVSFTKGLALEWARYNINVNAVAPGNFRWGMTESLFNDPPLLQRVTRRIPLRRFGEPSDIGALVAFLASDLSDYITGEVFLIDGGYSLP